MKKTISTYWPVAILIPIVLAFYLNAAGGKRADATPHEIANNANVSAQLARAVSFGYVEPDDAWSPVDVTPSEPAASSPRA